MTDSARLASIADAVAQKHGRAIPRDWQEPKHAHLLRAPAAFVDALISDLADDGTSGDALPWQKARTLFRLRQHELTVWAGSNGSGKSTLLSEIMLSLASAGRRIVVLSLEMPAYRVASKMVRQAFCGLPNRSRIESWAEAMAENISYLDFVGDMAPDECVRLVKYCAHELQTHHILIDNLTKIVSADNEHMEQQRLFMARLHRTAIDTGIHIHVVAHTRKPHQDGDERRPPGRYEVAGSRTLVDQPDNVCTIWRKRAAQTDEQAGALAAASDPEMIVRIDKQRHGRHEGQIALWMDRQHFRTVGNFGDQALPMEW